MSLRYGEACQVEDMVFRAMTLEVLGGMHEAIVSTVRRLGQSLARAGGQKEGEVIRHLLQTLSILLMKGSSALISLRSPSHINSNIKGDL